MTAESVSPLCLFVDGIAIIDSAVADAERGLFGATWLVDLTLMGPAGEPGMVLDFGRLKPQVKGIVDEVFDHVLIVPEGMPGLVIEQEGACLTLRWKDAAGEGYRHQSPANAVLRVPGERVTHEGIAALIRARLETHLGGSGAELEIRVRDEPVAGATYSYCHGLEHHAGRCQRIAHGHRSRLEVWVDGRRDGVLEVDWAARWRDIYVGSRAHLVAAPDKRCRFAYDAGEGHFELDLPAARCALIDTESTVEQIAAHIATRLAAKRPGQQVLVRAFEGVGKGGIGTATAR